MLICGIIKPEAIRYQLDIVELVTNAGVVIRKQRILRYSKQYVDVFYDHLPPEARAAIFKRLFGWGRALMLEVESVERLLDIAGRESDPRACAPGTIRARFGRHEPPTFMGTEPWWENAFHRPIDQREAERDLACVFGTP